MTLSLPTAVPARPGPLGGIVSPAATTENRDGDGFAQALRRLAEYTGGKRTFRGNRDGDGFAQQRAALLFIRPRTSVRDARPVAGAGKRSGGAGR